MIPHSGLPSDLAHIVLKHRKSVRLVARTDKGFPKNSAERDKCRTENPTGIHLVNQGCSDTKGKSGWWCHLHSTAWVSDVKLHCQGLPLSPSLSPSVVILSPDRIKAPL